MIFSERNLYIHHFRDIQSVVECLAQIGEGNFHLLPGFYIKLIVWILHPVGFIYLSAGLNAKHGIVGGCIGLADVVRVVCCNKLQAKLAGEFYKPRNNLLLLRKIVVLYLYKIAVLAEYIDKLARSFARPFIIRIEQKLRYNSVEASA